LIFEAISFLSQIELSQLFAAGWFPRVRMFSIPTGLVGHVDRDGDRDRPGGARSGLASAIYLSRYASPRVRGVVKPILEILAGIPASSSGSSPSRGSARTLSRLILSGSQGLQLSCGGPGRRDS
jgi:hypothetical protein